MAVDTSCIEWTGARTVLGYGFRNVKGKRTYVHRIAYCEANGIGLEEIRGYVVRHKCDNPKCHRADHLELGSQADNLRDMWSRGRGKTNPRKGIENVNAKVTEKEVMEMRAMYVKGSSHAGLSALAKRFGIDRSQVQNIVTRKHWAHVGMNDGR